VANTWIQQVSTVNTVIDLSDARTQRAIGIAADSGQWARCTARDGRRLFGIPSSKPSVRYLTDATSCTCPDQKFNRHLDCKHILAVRIVEALAA
jgi:hypothetical protein